ncbi:ATP-binding protein [Streptacidiphilus sp. P02-A3a]|uniref:ATP-binding protein n=1 Tax=Streptacidiphilus sp. P02-A3a TaxID=2704468 RepID=UPI001CDB6186|nr:ATP-binding protein [Streptacidiphilus sp. P02-A3a]
MSSPRVWGLSCPGCPEEIGRARRWAREILSGTPCADDAALIVSELSTNAVRHTASAEGGGTFHVTLTISPGTLTVAVTDEGTKLHAPEVQQAGTNATHGRGLDIVHVLAHQVAITGDHLGRTITAELQFPHQEIPAQ